MSKSNRNILVLLRILTENGTCVTHCLILSRSKTYSGSLEAVMLPVVSSSTSSLSSFSTETLCVGYTTVLFDAILMLSSTLLVGPNVFFPLDSPQAPSERARLYFLLAWFHAIVQERLRYVPLGWSKRYEFSESDLRVACDTLDTWLDSVAQVRDN